MIQRSTFYINALSWASRLATSTQITRLATYNLCALLRRLALVGVRKICIVGVLEDGRDLVSAVRVLIIAILQSCRLLFSVVVRHIY